MAISSIGTLKRLILMALIAISVVSGNTLSRKKLIYILLDGFRYNYLDKMSADRVPGFTDFLRNGVKAEYVIPIYPTLSLPNYETLVTGLYAESHGIVGNNFYDSADNDFFLMSDDVSMSKEKWWTREPIWATATKKGIKTANLYWGFCDVPFEGVRVDYCQRYKFVTGTETFKQIMEKAMAKLEEDFHFIMVYSEDLDYTGHVNGPESEKLKTAIESIDEGITYMLDRLKQLNMEEDVNIIIVSDHGMTSTGPTDVRRIELDDYLLTDDVENIVEGGPLANIKVKNTGNAKQVYKVLTGMPGSSTYLHDDIPERLHFKHQTRVQDILVKADIDTYMLWSRIPGQYPPREDGNKTPLMGMHGYDNQEEKMRAIFFASGPDFKKNEVVPPIEAVDVYPLLAHLLQVSPNPNNGTIENIKATLTSSSGRVVMETGVLLPLITILCYNYFVI